jgi:hypothetical protein
LRGVRVVAPIARFGKSRETPQCGAPQQLTGAPGIHVLINRRWVLGRSPPVVPQRDQS